MIAYTGVNSVKIGLIIWLYIIHILYVLFALCI